MLSAGKMDERTAMFLNHKLKYILLFVFSILTELWVWYLSIHLLLGNTLKYTEDQLFWFFIITTFTPILFVFAYHAFKGFLTIIGLLTILSLVVLSTPQTLGYFIPSLPVTELVLLIAHSFAAVTIAYFTSSKEIEQHLLNGMTKVLMLFSAVYLVVSFLPTHEFSELKVLIVAIAVPGYIFAMGLIMLQEYKRRFVIGPR